jgi:hypothetical protein
MGAGQSLPSQLTLSKVTELTKEPRFIMNNILNYMLKELSIRDIYSLSNPNECKKYVLVLANNIYKRFYELGISVYKGKKDVLLFRSVKDLTTNPSESEKVEQQGLCLILAYFYVRIFQIYGAIALSLMDDINIISEKTSYINTSSNVDRLKTPGTRPQIVSYGGGISGGISGGGKLATGNPYYFLNEYLEDDFTASYGFKTKYSKSGSSVMIFFNSTGTSSGTFTIGNFSGTKPVARLAINSADSEIFGTRSFVFASITIKKKSDDVGTTIKIPDSVLKPKKFSVDSGTKNPVTGRIQYLIKKTASSDPQTITEYFDDTLNNIVTYLQSVVKDSGINVSSYNTTKSADTYYISEEKERDIPDALKLNKLLFALKQKPLGHCVARGLQLLKSIPLAGEDGYSNICKAKFIETKDGATRSGIPEPGSSLKTSPGMFALAQLFYDTVQKGTPKLGVSEQSLKQFTEFAKTMSILFGSETPNEYTLVQQGIDSISNKRDAKLCDGKKDSEIRVPAGKVGDVYKYVNLMFRKHVEHSAKAMQIFNMLFNIKKDKSTQQIIIAFNDNILKIGIPEINRISYIARQYLISYYTDCESFYLKGMREVLSATEPVPAPGTGATGASATGIGATGAAGMPGSAATVI